MDKLLALLSGRNGSHRIEDLLLLLLRLAIGGAMLTHGVGKIMNFSELAPTFIDPVRYRFDTKPSVGDAGRGIGLYRFDAGRANPRQRVGLAVYYGHGNLRGGNA